MKNLEIIIEAILFSRSEPISKKKLAGLVKVGEGELNDALNNLAENLSNRGVKLVRSGDDVMLGTAPEAHELIESIRKEELDRDLGRAGLETLSIVIYKGPIAKSEIDFIRGVNSQFILRNLLVRGLVERIPNPDGRGGLYQITLDLLRYLGVDSVEKLPDYQDIKEKLKGLELSDLSESQLSPSEKTEIKHD